MTLPPDPRPFSGPREAGVSGLLHGGGPAKPPGFCSEIGGLVADGPVRPILVVVSDPSLHLFGRVRKRQEPVRVQAFASEAAVERLDEGVVGYASAEGRLVCLRRWAEVLGIILGAAL